MSVVEVGVLAALGGGAAPGASGVDETWQSLHHFPGVLITGNGLRSGGGLLQTVTIAALRKRMRAKAGANPLRPNHLHASGWI